MEFKRDGAPLCVLEVFGEAVLYGAQCVVFVLILFVHISAARLTVPHRILLWSAHLMFVLTSAHLSLHLARCITERYTDHLDIQATTMLRQTTFLIADLVLVWRVWVVWNRRKRVVVVPTLLAFGGFAVNMVSAASFTADNLDAYQILLPLPTVVLAAANTALCTGLIAGRLAYMEYRMARLLGSVDSLRSSYKHVILVVTESGAVLTLVHLVSLVLERLNHIGLYVVTSWHPPIMSLVPMVIIVLSHYNLNPGDRVNDRMAETNVVLEAGLQDARKRQSPEIDWVRERSVGVGDTTAVSLDVENGIELDMRVGANSAAPP